MREDRPRQALIRVLHVAPVQHKIRQLDAELDVSYRLLRQHVEQFAGTPDAPAVDLVGPVEIDEVSVFHKAG